MSHKIAFLGDVVLNDIREDKFNDISTYFVDNNINTCINLESPFVDNDNLKAIKHKICLKAKSKEVYILNKFNPFLINLSNNHVNDYGNKSSLLTINTLKSYDFNVFGVGKSQKKENIYFDESHNIIYVSYTTRSSDLTGSKLFAEKNFIGPYDVDYSQLKYLKLHYPKHLLIVSIHWGIEDIKNPEPEKRDIGKKIIDCGADLIIGHHPHIIQPYEVYKNKLIYYSIGNFYFPEIEYSISGKKYIKKPLSHQKKGIVPIFSISKTKIVLDKILLIKNEEEKIFFEEDYKLKQLKMNNIFYLIVYKITYYYKTFFMNLNLFLKYFFTDPNRLYSVLKKRIVNDKL